MQRRFEISRRASVNDAPYLQRIDFAYEDEGMTVILALDAMNRTPELLDVDGRPVGTIRYECNCLQKKCGACAMLINGRPALACDVRLADLPEGPVRLEPLKKFPAVADLIVDRSGMRDSLREMELWFEGDARMGERGTKIAYEASRCLACGCCLEVCPNFYSGGTFAGAAANAAASRMIALAPSSQRGELSRAYVRRFYDGCGKSLACQDICPAELPLESLLSRSNAAAVWRRWLG